MIKVIAETTKTGKIDANVNVHVDKEIEDKANYLLSEATAIFLATCGSLREKLSDDVKKDISVKDFLEIIYLNAKMNLEEDKETLKEHKDYGSTIN